MAPTLSTLAQSESKLRFMERLGLSSHVAEHKVIYSLMKTEAIKGRETMLIDRNVLLPHMRDDTAIQPPYSSSQVTESAMRDAVLLIYETASPETRKYYDQGYDICGVDEVSGRPIGENWIIRWMLWHVFRYRDRRNKHRAPSNASTASTASTAESPTTDYSAKAAAATRYGSYSSSAGFRPIGTANVGQSSLEDPQMVASTRPQGSLPYDPTRDG